MGKPKPDIPHEVEGGYLWSPKRSASGARNPFYESMREVSPGDLIFSFMDTRIQAIPMSTNWSSEPGSSNREPLQALAGFLERRAIEW